MVIIMEKLDGVLYPALVLSGILVTVFSFLGIATMTGWIPYASSNEILSSVQNVSTDVATSAIIQKSGAVQIAQQCLDCGEVDSISITEVEANLPSSGAISGNTYGIAIGNHAGISTISAAGDGAENEIRTNTHQSSRFVVHVSMDAGGYRTFYLDHQPTYRVGERIKIDNGNPIAMN